MGYQTDVGFVGSAAGTYLLQEQNRTSDRPESTNVWHLVAFYLSGIIQLLPLVNNVLIFALAGTFASLVSHAASTKLTYPRLVKQLASPAALVPKAETWAASLAAASSISATTALKTTPSILPSLGASGAVYACLTLTASAFPDSKIALAVPPSYPLNIQYGMGGLVCLDLIGVIRGWRCVSSL